MGVDANSVSRTPGENASNPRQFWITASRGIDRLFSILGIELTGRRGFADSRSILPFSCLKNEND